MWTRSRRGALIFDPSSPLESIRRQFATVEYDDSSDPARAAKAETAIVFADKWMTETRRDYWLSSAYQLCSPCWRFDPRSHTRSDIVPRTMTGIRNNFDPRSRGRSDAPYFGNLTMSTLFDLSSAQGATKTMNVNADAIK
jgi:hypothetical protein